ncbi:MAG: hypothetical protein J7500_08260 [Sphingomonas sp.]|uniref:hypothetical protein n=1 Tax=Sphingomonas sp. TaxID=28214 RepID=UPI001B0BEB7B|nr:hypothetical protein [Sphingomonas sp.]MBO9622692.1 hypothetical protein [Sphingomonas sp.]
MKILVLAAAAAAAVLATPAASAAPIPAVSLSEATYGTVAAGAQERGWDRNDRRYHDNRRYRDRRHRRAHWKTVCTRQWRHGHRVRVCRKVRVWR